MLAAAERFGKVPPALRAKPILSAASASTLEIFLLLFSGDSIPLADIVIYCDLVGIDDSLKVIAILKELEKIVVEHQNGQLKNGRKT